VVVGIAAIVIMFATSALAQSLQEQEMCAKQARAAFNEEKREGLSDYQNHFNTKLKKCLMLIETTAADGGRPHVSAMLIDANERRVYAAYYWYNAHGKKYWEVPPTSCELDIHLSGQKTICSSREEFDAFVARYMEE
jgi:hypothetical protein